MNNNLKLALAVGFGAVLSAAVITQGSHIGLKIGSASDARIKQIVRDVIKAEPQLIIESVQNMQNTEQQKKAEKAGAALKDKSLQLAIYNDVSSAFVGPADAKNVVVEFFDYNCPACKMQFTAIEQLVKKHDDVKVIFKEYPIFGPQSDTNSKIGLAVNAVAPEKYYEFHRKMMALQGRADEAAALKFVKEIGVDVAKVKVEMNKKETADIIENNRAVGDKLHIQGTPTVIIGKEVVPHAVSYEEMASKFGLDK